MGKQPAAELIQGTCQQFLFSPKGQVEGVLLTVKGGTAVQVAMPAQVGAQLARTHAPGRRVRVLGRADDSPKALDGEHPVYVFEAFADPTGKPLKLADEEPSSVTIKGVADALHYSRHGQANGVLLDTGDFIHLRPSGMAQAGLGVGAKVSATGELRMTLLGTRMLEAQRVNRIHLV